MADFNKVSADRSLVSAGSMGNKSIDVVDLDSIGAMAAASVFYVCKIPKGSIITGLKLNAIAGLSAASGTIDIGYIMGATTDDDYFASAFNTVTGGQKVSVAFPLECTDDCYITVTVNTSTTVVDKRMSVITEYEFKGEV